MLYYIQTGDINTSVRANSPKNAAIKAIENSENSPGICVIVSKEKISSSNSDSNTFFFTDSIMNKFVPKLRVVNWI